jgi:ribonuclease HII
MTSDLKGTRGKTACLMSAKTIETTNRLYGFDRAIAVATDASMAGIDEAGRGPLAGPVVAAAVVLDLDSPISGINDSKKLSEKKREELYGEITTRARAWAAGMASVKEIDDVNILQATFLAMQRALEALRAPWSLVLVDGNQYIRDLPQERQRTIVHGDAASASIAAASIIAKVTRDRIMREYHARFPKYDFISNKGYGTASHCRSLREFGLCEHHRRSFCENILAQTRLEL